MNRATRLVVSTFGLIVGLAGIEHGIGEVLQGNTAPGGMMIKSWPDSEFFRIVAGEPAMTIIPNLLVTGLLAILFSLIFLVCVLTGYAQRKNGGLVLIVLSIVMLLVGGGFGPPILGIIVGVTATQINAPLTWWRAHVSVGVRRLLGGLWMWLFAASVTTWLLLFPGTSILHYFFNVSLLEWIPLMGLCALGFLLLTIFTGLAYDSQQHSGASYALSMSA
jgi:hypothetical protein